MAEPAVHLGPLRCLQGPIRGVVDVDFDGERLVLTRYRGLDLIDRYLLVLSGVALLCGTGALYVDAVARVALLAAGSAIVAVVVLGLLVRVLRSKPAGTSVEVLETDLDLMDPVTAGTFPRLTLYSQQGEIVLRGAPWRGTQLRNLQRRLADEPR